MIRQLLLLLAVGVMARLVLGPLVIRGWESLVGRDRTSLERWLAALALGAGLLLGLAHTPPLALVVSVTVVLCVRAAFPKPTVVEPREPQSLVLTHDGWSVELRHVPTWPALVALALLGTLRGPLILVAIVIAAAALTRRQRTRLRIHKDRIDAGGATLPLRDLEVREGHGLLGSRRLYLGTPAHQKETPIGHHDACELAWLKRAISEASKHAPPPESPPPPSLTRLRRAGERDES